MEYLFVNWHHIETLVATLAESIRKRDFRPDMIVGVSRGGLVPTRLLSDYLDVRNVAVLGVAFYQDLGETGNEPRITHPLRRDVGGKKVVLVDDVADTGSSLEKAMSHVSGLEPSSLLVCTLHLKPWSTFEPHIYAEETDKWIIYAWEKMEAGSHIVKDVGNGKAEDGLLAAGFSSNDIELLRSLKLKGLDPDTLENEH